MDWAIEKRGYSQRRACALVAMHPKTYRYASTREDDTELRATLKALARERRASATGGCTSCCDGRAWM